MQNADGRLILTAEVTKNKIGKTSKIYLNKFARYFGLQYKPSNFIFRHFRRQDQSAVCILHFRYFTVPGLQEIRHYSSVCRCGIANFYCICYLLTITLDYKIECYIGECSETSNLK